MFLQELLGSKNLEWKELSLTHNVSAVFRNQALRANPFGIAGNKGVAALETLSNIPLNKFKRNAPPLVHRNFQSVQIGIDFGHLLRQKMTAYFVEDGTADAEQILLSIRGDMLQQVNAHRLRVGAERKHVLVGIKDEVQGIRAKIPRASS